MKIKAYILTFLFSFLICSILVLPTNAISSYYNWIDNSSFLQEVNLIEDNSFESALYNEGVIYGNWSVGTGSFELTNPYTGTYSYYLNNNLEYIFYNFTDDYQFYGADIEKFSFYAYPTTNPLNIGTAVVIYYSDDTSDTVVLGGDEDEWSYIDITDEIELNKIVIAFKVYLFSGSCQTYIDDFIFFSSVEGAQNSLDGTSEPWFVSGSRPTGYDIEDVMSLIDNFGRTDNYSVASISGYDTPSIGQWINNLEVDNIYYIDMYAYCDSGVPVDVLCDVYYTDGSYEHRSVEIQADGSWEYVNFGSSWLDSGKIIRRIYFSLEVGTYGLMENYGYTVYFDDVGLWSNVPTTFSKFSYYLTPSGVNEESGLFYAYCNSLYVMSCSVYNSSTFELQGNGTYTWTDSFGVETGNITNGEFDFVLDERTFTTTPYKSENIVIKCTFEYEIFSITLSARWYPTEGGSSDIGDINDDFILDWFLIAIFLLAIPLTITMSISGLFGGSNVNPSILITSFLASETLMGAISLQIGVINIWFMFVIIIMDVLFILILIRSNSN